MKDGDLLVSRLEELAEPNLPEALRARTLARAEAWLETEKRTPQQAPIFARAAVPALLFSAAAVLALDVWVKIRHVFGG
jgi:hypothetical protein